MKYHLHAASLEVEVQCFLQMQNLGRIISYQMYIKYENCLKYNQGDL